jgi:hypothetical protein
VNLARSEDETDTLKEISIPAETKILAFFLDIVFSYFYTFGNCSTRAADSM